MILILKSNPKQIVIEKTLEDEQNQSQIEEVGKYFNVEYFVENGAIKFRETDSGTPFYIQQFRDRSELTIKEKSYTSTYSESIEKCFKIHGAISGNYKNIKPGFCEFETNSNTWIFLSMGELEGK